MNNSFFTRLITATLVVASLVSVGCRRGESSHGEHHHHGGHEEEPSKGPHRGRMLTCDDFSAELAIYERGTPPRFRLYVYEGQRPVPAAEVTAVAELRRLGGVVDSISFKPVDDFLESEQVVYEPHSFDVFLRVSVKGGSCEWRYSSYEARTTISPAVAERSGIASERAGSQDVSTIVRARGKILPHEHLIAHVIPRYPGVVREGRKHVGDPVEKGEVVAVIESNESLQPFEVRSQIAGTIINGHLIVGEFVPDNQWVYIVADLSVVWADLFVPLRESSRLALGQEVQISSVNSEARATGRVTYLAPYADERSQSRLVRVELPNPHGEFLPGAHVTGDILVERVKVPVAVERDALQRYNDWLVVFVREGDTYEARPVEVGREDSQWVEVTSGLSPNTEYVAENGFLVKADILKSGATHDH